MNNSVYSNFAANYEFEIRSIRVQVECIMTEFYIDIHWQPHELGYIFDEIKFSFMFLFNDIKLIIFVH